MATNDALAGLLLAGRYRLHQRRGAGGDGLVMDAVDEQLQRPVAVRVLSTDWAVTPMAEQSFRAEAQVASSLIHPNINAVYDWGIEDFDGATRPYIVLEYLSGGSLRDILDRGRLLSSSQALVVGLDACRALDYIHRRGILHRDLRPATLVFGGDHHLRLVDLGISRLRAEQTWADLSAAGIDAARYASPEQAQGCTTTDGSLGPASDVYALCLILIEAVTGQIPFASDSTVATLNARIDKLMPVSADFGPLASILERAGRPLPADRFTAAEFGRALMQAAERLPRPAPIPTAGNALFAETSGAMLRPVEPTPLVDRARLGHLPVFRKATSDAPVPPPAFAPPAGTEVAVSVEPPTFVPADVAVAEVPADVAEVPVYDQGDERPRSSRWWMLVLLIAVLALVAGGLAGYRMIVTKSYVVPKLAGIEKTVAQNQIADNGWDIVIKTERSDEQALGNVISTDPGPGAKLRTGKAFVLLVSEGPTLPKLVDVTGMTLDAATAKLINIKLAAPQSTDTFDETVPTGAIMSWSVPAQPSLLAGMEVVQGTVVAVVVSKGPAPRTVPALAGLDEAAATAALAAVQLTVVHSDDVFSNDVAVGHVAQQSVAPGAAVDRGSSVAISISKGPDFVTMPNLVGLDYAAVQAAVAAAGLHVGAVTGNTAGYLYAINVGGVRVIPAQQILRGTAIDLFYY